MTTIFVDTNVLLHAKQLKDIAWEERHQAPVTIVVTRTNVKELDKHKDHHPKRHLRERARRALQMIEAATASPGIRKGTTLIFDDRPSRIDLSLHDLDEKNPDDVLIASVIAHRDQYPNDVTILYTYDVGPRLTARRLGLDARTLPDEDRLAPQVDETERENERLKKELHDLQTAAPQLHIAINKSQTAFDVRTLGKIPEAMTEEMIRIQVSHACEKLPTFDRQMAANPKTSSRPPGGKFVLDLNTLVTTNPAAIGSREYDRYELRRAQYEADYGAYVLQRHEAQLLRSRTVALEIALQNSGGKPADDIDIELVFPSNYVIATDAPTLPSPPTKPMPPKTEAELFNDKMQAAVGLNTNHFPSFKNFNMPDINPSKCGPWIRQTAISWWVRSLKHGFVEQLDTVYIISANEPLRPFDSTYVIRAANAVRAFNGKITVKPIARD